MSASDIAKVRNADRMGKVPENWLELKPDMMSLATEFGVGRTAASNWVSRGAPLILCPALFALWNINAGTKTGRTLAPLRKNLESVLGLATPLDLDLEDKAETEKKEQAELPGECDYDFIVSPPDTYQEALQREKVKGEEIENEKRKLQRDVEKGRYLPITEASNVMRSIIDHLEEQLKQAAGELSARFAEAGIDTETMGTLHEVVESWSDEAADRLSDAATATKIGRSIMARIED